MVKYFCECCGREMDNSVSHKIIFMSKNQKVSVEKKNEEYSLFDDDRKICDSCFNTILSFIDNAKELPNTTKDFDTSETKDSSTSFVANFFTGLSLCAHAFIINKADFLWYDCILRFFYFIHDKLSYKKDCNTF